MNGWYRTGYLLSKALAKLFFGYRVIHRERIPIEGGFIFAANHQSFLDPPLLGIACDRDIYFLARKTLLDWPVLGPIFPKINVVPVDQERPDMSALKAVIRIVRAGNGTVVFPEGGRTDDGTLQAAQPGLGLIIAKTLAPVVPARIFGAYAAYPRGARFPRPHRITVVVGEPIHFTEADVAKGGRDVYQRLSERVMERIAALELPE